MKNLIVALTVLLPLAGICQEQAAPPQKEWAYFGTYTGRGSEGIYVAEFDATTGHLGAPRLAAKTVNPSFLAVHPNRRFLYAVNEVDTFEGKPGGAVTAFSMDVGTGRLWPLNSQSSGGAGPCHLSLDRAGKMLYVANYGGGSVASIAVRDDGSLGDMVPIVHRGTGPNKARQEKAHAHSINVTPDDGYAVAADLGLDQVIAYRLDEARRLLTQHGGGFTKVPPGGGPRHFAFHPNGKFGYVNNELTSTVTVFQYDAKNGTLTTLETVSTLPSDFKGKSGTAEIQVHPNGKYLYVSNRGHDSLAVFRINPDGQLSAAGHVPTGGKTPRNFCIDPTGRFLLAANQDSDNVVVFRINAESGQPQATGQSVNVATPVCVRFVKR